MRSETSVVAGLSRHLGVPQERVHVVKHPGSSTVARVDGLGMVKLFESGSDKLGAVLLAASELDRHSLDIAPRVLDRVNLPSGEVAVVFEAVEGEHASPDWLASEAGVSSLSTLLATLHQVAGAAFFRTAGGAQARSWTECVEAALDGAERRYEQRVGGRPPAVFGSAVRAAQALCLQRRRAFADVEPSLVHRDVSSRNLIRRGDGSLALIDFELAAFYDPVFDLVKLELLRELPPQRWDSLFRAYASKRGEAIAPLIDRYEVCRALEVIWGYPALVAMKSPAADQWLGRLEEIGADRC